MTMARYPRALWLIGTICLLLVFSGCKVITPTPDPSLPVIADDAREEVQHAYPEPMLEGIQVSAKGMEGAASPDSIAGLTSETGPEASTAAALTIEQAAAVAGQPYYEIQSGSPAYLENFARPEACNWMGIAGQVFSASGEPVPNLVIVVGGTLSGKTVSNKGITGNAPVYGPGGYEIDLSLIPAASTKTLWVQLTDAQGQVLTSPVYIDTYADCMKSLVLVNYQQVLDKRLILPVMFRQ
jgi:hypothetical protein